LPDFTSYVPPGVYVQDTSLPVVTPTSVSTNIVTIVGPANGYQTNTDNVAVYWNTRSTLSQRGIFVSAVTGPPPIAAPVVKNAAGVTMVVSVDYTFTVDTSGGGGAANAVTYIQRLGQSGSPSATSPNGLNDGDIVSVTYNYADPTYFTPQVFTDPSAVATTYGAAVVSTAPTNPNASQVLCPLTLATQIAMANGSSNVLCLALNPSDGTLREQFTAAYAKIQTDYRAELLVPLFVDGTTQGDSTAADAHSAAAVLALVQDMDNFCVGAASNGFGSIGFAGTETNYDSTTQPFPTLAGDISSKRAVLTYPNQLSFYNNQLNQTTVISGYYLAAAMAGALAAGDVDRGLTNVALTGFNGFPAVLAQAQTTAFKNSLSSSGVCVAQINRSGQMVVRHGLTTDMSALTTREISLVRIGDVLLQSVQTGMDAAGLIGQPIDSDMTTKVKGALTGILELAVTNNVINAYGNVAVQQQALPNGDPSVINVTFAYQPSVPLNYITVTFAIDLNSGDFTNTTTTDTTTGTSTS
jgi:hypothetical protein